MSREIGGALAVLVAVFAVAFLPLDGRARALLAALVIVVAGGTRAFLQNRKAIRRL
jgi:hypothetical protein